MTVSRGRPPASSREAIEAEAMRLFRENGYSATTIPMIAAATGVSRTSVFRYWGTKAEIVWSEFDHHTTRLGELLRDADPRLSTMDIVREQTVVNLALSMGDSPAWMERFAVLDSTPELRADGSERWSRWANTVAAFVARRHGFELRAVIPQSIGAAVQAAFLAVLRDWQAVDSPTVALLPGLDIALRPLAEALQALLDAASDPV